uniref:Uncharacterized protein n=1 Tax=Rhizophora mucronata TaxID=61149 RepID=A0A2P2NTJ9_RHIMU
MNKEYLIDYKKFLIIVEFYHFSAPQLKDANAPTTTIIPSPSKV